jgi:hypothetical protein
MRIDIKTKGARLVDKDIRALYLLIYALDNSTPKMKTHNLAYVADRNGFKLVKKQP